ncbi:MAG: glycosyltransferase [Chitinispirillales bacterium]|jgi:glycosyltransferase involved in cell wall biosynthesis|nr:glycosyltransferase [Chitinispirillales bacterium]
MKNGYKLAVSVIVPTYKPQSYIAECFKSINNQSFCKNDFEVIVILNGEREPYYSFLENCLSEYLFNYKLLYTSVTGVSNARNIGIEQSTGTYLAFIDDDDVISESYLLGLYNIAKNNRVPLSYIKAFTDDVSNNINYYYTNVYEKMLNKELTVFNTRSYFSIVYCKLISREMIGTHKFNETFQNSEDALFMFTISKRKMTLQFTDKTAVYYRRIRNNSLNFRKISLLHKIKNQFRLVFATVAVYLKAPTKYSFLFFLSRILAYLRTITVRNS